MNTLSILLSYVEVGGLIALAYLVFAAVVRGLGERIHPSEWARLGVALLIASPAFALLARLAPRQALFRPAAQVFSGGGRHGTASFALVTRVARKHVVAAPSGVVLSQALLTAVAAILAVVILLQLIRLVWRVLALHREIARMPLLRRIGRVSIHASDEHRVAFSTWLPGRARIVVPMPMVSSPRDLRICLGHELQHHRHGDTRWLYVVELLHAFYFWNPAVRAFGRELEDLQELACDEFLIGRRKISPRAYGSCLFRAAQSAAGQTRMPVGTACMSVRTGRSSLKLKRRIEMILSERPRKGKRSRQAIVIFGAAAGMALATAAFAARSAVQDRHLTLAEARDYAAKASEGAIPITVNERVLERLNHFIGTAEGRQFVRGGLERMPKYQPMIERKLREQGMPSELVAVALHESGFRNDVVSPPPYHAAGIWQFIPSTARHYHLEVSAERDERLDPEKATDAALHYLKDLNSEFQDWRLALKAYNEGERKVESLIERTGTRDPWVLEETQTSENYVASTTAMIILLRNPSLVN